ncbi:MAG: NUDIX hydrolase, partial [Thermoleophilia bacterium]|nr:NUDIX hydrolase [Thermoleophilia bacterium]
MPRHAASVIVLREREQGLEILFVRRSPELKFMGGAWVFPGGSLSESDGEHHEDELAYRRCGIRETFEEASIQLPDPRQLVPFSRWITPELAPIRFDTRFYLARDPEDGEPVPDGVEIDLAEWWTPAKALYLHMR